MNFLTDEMQNILLEKLQRKLLDPVIDFKSLMRLVGNLRNVTKAHGFIRDDELISMFKLMFCMAICVFIMVDIIKIKIDCDNLSKYVFIDSNDLLFVSTNRDGRYINMTTGEIRILKK